jgi:hypothetical protein
MCAINMEATDAAQIAGGREGRLQVVESMVGPSRASGPSAPGNHDLKICPRVSVGDRATQGIGAPNTFRTAGGSYLAHHSHQPWHCAQFCPPVRRCRRCVRQGARRRESNYCRVLITRKLLILQIAKIARIARNAEVRYTRGTRLRNRAGRRKREWEICAGAEPRRGIGVSFLRKSSHGARRPLFREDK